MLDITIQLDISVMLNNHLPSHEKKLLKKRKKKENKKIWGD